MINPGIVTGGKTHIVGETMDGTHAELIAIPRAFVHPIPGDLSFEEAAAFPLVFQTAYRMLVTRARAAGGRVGPDLGDRRRRRDGCARDREGARRAGRRHVVERREAAAGARARRRRDRQPRNGRRRRPRQGGHRRRRARRRRRRRRGDLEANARRGAAGGTRGRLRRHDRPEPAGGTAPRLVEAALDPRLDDGHARRLPGRLRPRSQRARRARSSTACSRSRMRGSRTSGSKRGEQLGKIVLSI